ncbi:MAG: S-methyl-5-thioribose-1-phosphate isomerase, partial [Dehalococcoidia bacterium]
MESHEDIEPIRWVGDHLELLDQTLLPERQEWVRIHEASGAVTAIREMRVRGAPAIGVTAAYAMALAARGIDAPTMAAFLDEMDPIAAKLAAARPTAVNLGWAVQRCVDTARSARSPSEAREKLLELAHRIKADDIATNRAIGKLGAPLLPDGGGVLTHCNTGALATAGYGTALGVIRAAWEQGKRPAVFCTETRPWLQGARLTAWELVRLGIPARLVVDSAAGSLIGRGDVSVVVVGADRIAANG